jgi:uncharacterized protein (DUF2141 family)
MSDRETSHPASKNAIGQYSVRSKASAMTVAAAEVLCGVSLPASSRADSGALIVEASGFHDHAGHAVAKLFFPGEDVLKRGHQEIKADIREGKATLAFPSLPAGDYAVVVFHDANDNGVIDHNILGIPTEQLGFSNVFELSLTSGLPSFDKLRFAHGASLQTIAIRVEAL